MLVNFFRIRDPRQDLGGRTFRVEGVGNKDSEKKELEKLHSKESSVFDTRQTLVPSIY